MASVRGVGAVGLVAAAVLLGPRAAHAAGHTCVLVAGSVIEVDAARDDWHGFGASRSGRPDDGEVAVRCAYDEGGPTSTHFLPLGATIRGRERWVVNKLRALNAWYSKGYEGGSQFRTAINRAESVAHVRELVGAEATVFQRIRWTTGTAVLLGAVTLALLP